MTADDDLIFPKITGLQMIDCVRIQWIEQPTPPRPCRAGSRREYQVRVFRQVLRNRTSWSVDVNLPLVADEAQLKDCISFASIVSAGAG